MTDEIERKVLEVIEEYGGISKREDGMLVYEICATYDDYMDDKSACEILESDDPYCTLDEKLGEWYFYSIIYYEDELLKDVLLHLDCEVNEDELLELIRDTICFDVPRDHYLAQEFCVNIMMDTGDGNYDYTLNSVYPCYYGRQREAHPDKTSIVWLAKQQGYKKGEFRNAMDNGDIKDPTGFLESMRQELANLPSHMATVTFLVRMTLRDLIELNRLIKLQDRNGHFYDATKNPYCGYIVLSKETETGLYDPWNGGGSVFEIQLEKDVRIPIRFIRSALPDGGDGRWSIESVYGMCKSCWRDTVKKIHSPSLAVC